MANWLTSARSAQQSTPQLPEPVPFERVCLCGGRLVGERREVASEIRCDRCGRTWFVLPHDPYPVPKTPKRRKKRKRGPRPGRRKSAGSGNPAAAVSKRGAHAVSAVGTKLRQSGFRILQAALARVKRAARPIRLVAGGIVLLILATGLWLWYQARLDTAAQTLVEAVPAAEAALADGDLPRADEWLAKAANAVDILGREDAKARRIRQRHRELQAIVNLAALTPFDLAREAKLANAAPQRWSRRFQTTYAGQWVILDVPLGEARPATTGNPPPDQRNAKIQGEQDEDSQEQDGEQTDQTRKPTQSAETVIPLQLIVQAGEVPIRFELEADAIEELADSSRAIVALQYKSWTMHTVPGGRPEKVWVVRFNAETAFPWVSPDLYEAAGFALETPYQPAGEQLARQAKWQGLSLEATPSEKPEPQPE